MIHRWYDISALLFEKTPGIFLHRNISPRLLLWIYIYTRSYILFLWNYKTIDRKAQALILLLIYIVLLLNYNTIDRNKMAGPNWISFWEWVHYTLVSAKRFWSLVSRPSSVKLYSSTMYNQHPQLVINSRNPSAVNTPIIDINRSPSHLKIPGTYLDSKRCNWLCFQVNLCSINSNKVYCTAVQSTLPGTSYVYLL